LPRDPESDPLQNAGSFIVNKAIRYMEENYSQKLTLQDVADCCYVS
jgi:YesN/AraC family two-component response regulator